VNTEEGFVDVDLRISSLVKSPDGSFTIDVKSKVGKTPVAFRIVISNIWKKNPIEKTDDFWYWGKGRFVSLGKETENFIEVMAQLYNVPGSRLQKTEIDFVAVGLANDPSMLDVKATKMKVFFNSESDNQDLYSEVFVNIDPVKKILEFHEKDQDYREPLVRSLAGQT